jgi:hypothetical protein
MARVHMSNIKVVSKTTWTISHGGLEVDVPDKLMKLIDGQPFLKMSATHYKLTKLVCGSVEKLPHNATLAGNPGLKQLKQLRNTAQGLGAPEVPAAANSLLDDEDEADGDDIPARQPRKARKKCTNLPDPTLAEDLLVSFELPGYGIVTALKANHPAGDFCVHMESNVLDHVFNFLVDSANDEEKEQKQQRRAYQQTGKWSKKS